MSFSFSIKKSPDATKPVAAAAPKAAASRGPLSVFKEALEAEAEREEQEAVRPTLSSFTKKPVATEKKKIDDLLKENPNAFSYDDVYENVSSGTAQEQQKKSQARRLYLGYTEDIKDKISKDAATADALAADAAARESPLGPPGLRGASQVGESPPQARFIGKLLVHAQRRQIEREIIQERQLQKEREREGGAADEVFVTGAYKARLEERQRIQQELERQEARDAARAADKQTDLSSFHAYLLKSGAATRSAAASASPGAPAAALSSSAAAAAAVPKGKTEPAVRAAKDEAETPASPPLQQPPQQQQEAESKCEPSSTSHNRSSSTVKVDKEMVLPYKRTADPKTVPVPDKLSTKDIASARARYLQRKKLKTEE